MATLIVSSNSNPVYLDFIDIQRQLCHVLGIKLFVCKCGMERWNFSAQGIDIPSIEGVPDVFVSQVSRFLIPAYFPEELFIVGDIDMLFLDKGYLNGLLKTKLNSHALTFVDSNTYESVLRFPMCYIIGFGNVFNIITKVGECNFDAFNEAVQRIYWEFGDWTGDEYYFTQCALLNSQKITIEHLNVRVKKGFANRRFLKGRINRDNWKYSRIKLLLNCYKDVHCLRPIGNNLDELKHLLNFIYCDLNYYKYIKYEYTRIFKGVPNLFPNFPLR